MQHIKIAGILTFLFFLSLESCQDSKENDPIITIVNIGHNDRIGIGKQIRIINQFSPRIVAFDFYLTPDSLHKDSILVFEIKKIKNSVQVVGLGGYIQSRNIWDSLEVSNEKFKTTNRGFANFSTQGDRLFIPELITQELYKYSSIFAFSYVVAEKSFGLKTAYTNHNVRQYKFDLDPSDRNYKLINPTDLALGNFRKEDLNNKIVLVGYIGEDEDYFYLDEARKRKVNGIEIHAAFINELIELR